MEVQHFHLLLTLSLLMPLLIIADPSSVQLINLLGDPVTTTCLGDNSASRGASVIGPLGSQEWEFDGGVLAAGWTCHFEWADSSDCSAAAACKVRAQDVKVWQGVMGLNRKIGASAISQLTRCKRCVWQIKFDGFYCADKTDLIYTFVVGWN